MKKLVIVAVMLFTFTLSADWSEGEQGIFKVMCEGEDGGELWCGCILKFLQKRKDSIRQLEKKDFKEAANACKEVK